MISVHVVGKEGPNDCGIGSSAVLALRCTALTYSERRERFARRITGGALRRQNDELAYLVYTYSPAAIAPRGFQRYFDLEDDRVNLY